MTLVETGNDRWKQDKFACYRKFFKDINNTFLKLRLPSAHVAIDEILYPYRAGIGFRQYNPKKPAKFGLLFRSLRESAVQYTYFSLPSAGKPEGTADDFYITGTDNYTKYLVDNAIRVGGASCLKGRNISIDRYFTSMAVAEWCLENNITIMGTMRTDRIGIPKEMKTETGRAEKSTLWCYEGKKC